MLLELLLKNIVNGPFTFGPENVPLIGPVPGMKNYWVAVGVKYFIQGVVLENV